MRSANVDSVQMCDSPVSLCDVDVLELDVHVVLGYANKLALSFVVHSICVAPKRQLFTYLLPAFLGMSGPSRSQR